MKDAVEWLDLAKRFDGKCCVAEMDPSENVSWLKYPFVLAFMHMLNPNVTFTRALRETLMLGGDTHVNCMIVGALVGARDGVESLPAEMTQKVIACDYQNGKRRPVELQPFCSFMRCFDKVFDKASSQVVVDIQVS